MRTGEAVREADVGWLYGTTPCGRLRGEAERSRGDVGVDEAAPARADATAVALVLPPLNELPAPPIPLPLAPP